MTIDKRLERPARLAVRTTSPVPALWAATYRCVRWHDPDFYGNAERLAGLKG